MSPDGRPAQAAPPSAERIALGVALQARADEVGQLVDDRFAVSLRGEAFATARLATELIGRWLATDEVAASDRGREPSPGKGRAGHPRRTPTWPAWPRPTSPGGTCTIARPDRGGGAPRRERRAARSGLRRGPDQQRREPRPRHPRVRRDRAAALQRRLREEQASLAHSALHDELTGLPNRALLTDRLRQAAPVAGAAGIPGPCCSSSTSTISRPSTTGSGTRPATACWSPWPPASRSWSGRHDTVARLGGDEFVILAEELSDPEVAARSLAKRIHEAMRAPVTVGDRELLDVGEHRHRRRSMPDADPEVNLAQADAAMYQAKRGGPARYEAYDEDNRRATAGAGASWPTTLRVAHGLGQLVHPLPAAVQSGR